ncbi:LysR family transcriptional regulator [Pigmentiphaga kullae]|uniref:DNA-binding transcriptional LysR family regulator n=1 Tax=Pigmentiphaga kullae TaxID=151784 RepID=A0A4Q7NIV7_9BURK|nr:LysR family transcriptional regulator [Pigmentiphaga kullae]RZS84752.1 DNA-binding transcriptional LysR family regulator [Pigmentiphaga kullae]
MDRLRLISTFLQAAQAKNFSEAASKLKIAPQAVSSQIAQLEAWLDIRLFQRTTRQVWLTEEGRIFYEKCRQGVALIEEGEAALRERHNDAVGTVRLAVGHSLGASTIAPLLLEFGARHPAIHVELLVLNQLADMVQMKADIGVIGGGLPDSSLTARRIGVVGHYLCAAPGYLAAQGVPRKPEDLHAHRCIALRHPRNDAIRPWSFKIGNEMRTLELPHAITVSDVGTQRWLVLNGAGVGQITDYYAEPLVRQGQLARIEVGYVSRPVELFIYMPRRELVPRRCRLLNDFLFEELRSRLSQ